ncbi:MAG: hypothetical protein M3081_06645 [Gemmatimonadota bacterium]|nr:hypothetical protein [Gemmatimonadota bacterium]
MFARPAALALLFIVASPVHAQTWRSAPFALESRVRVTGAAQGHSRIEGNMTELSADSIVLRERNGQRRAIAIADISRVDYLASSRSRAASFSWGLANGLAIGIASGAIIVGSLTYASCKSDPSNQGENLCGLAFPVFGALGGAVGLVVGGAVGATRSTEHWVQVPLPPRLGFDFSRGIGSRIAF